MDGAPIVDRAVFLALKIVKQGYDYEVAQAQPGKLMYILYKI
jgi:hypothetical protein